MDEQNQLVIEQADGVRNIFDVLPRVDDLRFEQNGALMPQHPFRMVCVGASGAGKTQEVMNRVIRRDFKWDRVYLYAADLYEPKYMQFIAYMAEVAEEAGLDINDILIVGSKPSEIVPLDEIDRDLQNLIIIDDFVNETKANKTIIADLFIRGRKLNCSVMYLTQVYYGVPKSIRMQSGYFMLFKAQNNRDQRMIAGELCDTSVTPELFISMHNVATNEPYGFLLVDRAARDKNMKYRIGWDRAIRVRPGGAAIDE